MLSLRSLAFILCSATRRARAVSRAAFPCFPDRTKALIIEKKIATNIEKKIATNRAASMSVSYEQFTASKGRTGHSRAVQPKNTINALLGHYPLPGDDILDRG